MCLELKRYAYVSTSPAIYCCAYVNNIGSTACIIYVHDMTSFSFFQLGAFCIQICKEYIWKLFILV